MATVQHLISAIVQKIFMVFNRSVSNGPKITRKYNLHYYKVLIEYSAPEEVKYVFFVIKAHLEA